MSFPRETHLIFHHADQVLSAFTQSFQQLLQTNNLAVNWISLLCSGWLGCWPERVVEWSPLDITPTTFYSNMRDVGIFNEPNQRWFRLLKANVSHENPVLRQGLGMDHCFWTEVSVCHSSLCGLALAISVLWYKYILASLTLQPVQILGIFLCMEVLIDLLTYPY